jgi:hypothetical protein
MITIHSTPTIKSIDTSRETLKTAHPMRVTTDAAEVTAKGNNVETPKQ